MKNAPMLLQSTVVICGIVRDCENNLKNNIPVIEQLRNFFKESHVVIFENDSKDNTKEVLSDWSTGSSNVNILSEKYNNKTIPQKSETQVNPFFSKYRIEKMCYFRNKYLDYIEANNIVSDYTIIVDLDISKIFINGILDSFNYCNQWDVVTANCYSTSPFIIRRYHDSYALVETGKEDVPQTEKSIKWSQYKWRYCRKNKFEQVYSAFGGFAIYKSHFLDGLRYAVITNNDPKVEVRCEHFALSAQIQKVKNGKIFVNKDMRVKYQKTSLRFILNKIKLLICPDNGSKNIIHLNRS